VTPDGTAWAVGAAGEVVNLPADRPNGRVPTSACRSIPGFAPSTSPTRKNGWLVGGYGTVLRTSDAGKSWRPLPRLSDSTTIDQRLHRKI